MSGLIKGWCKEITPKRAVSIKTDADGRLYLVQGGTPDLYPAASNVITLSGTSQQYTLPTPGGIYILKAVGGTAFVNEGAAPTQTVGAKGIVIVEGESFGPVPLTGPLLGVVAVAAGGYLYIVEIL